MIQSRISDVTKRLSLTAYDSNSFGPLFAVSDEGSAGQAIVEAAYASAKARAFSPIDPVTLGVALDGERMTSAGEVPIGPEEYEALSAAAAGLLLCTTNVGVRVNTRFTQQLPEFAITESSLADQQWFNNIFAAFLPFIQTPNNHPRPLTVRLSIKPDGPIEMLKALVTKLEAARGEGKIGPPDMHQFSVLIAFENEIVTSEQIRAIHRVIDATADAGLKEVAVDGEPREASRQRSSIQSLLNVLEIEHLRQLLNVSQQRGIHLTYRYQLDIESAARTIWTGLHTARMNGFAAGKYGLVPMSLEEQGITIELLTRWTTDWTAIPAFYVDTPLLTATDVYDVSRCEDAAMRWLKMSRGAGATIVLFDSPDRVNPRRLLRQSDMANDTGVLTIEAVERLLAYSKDLGVSILWSGGITSRQAFELAKRRVFGIFSTSSTASKIAVTAQFESDPRLAAENEPMEFGVRRIHAITQGGFLSTTLNNQDSGLAKSIELLTSRVLNEEQSATRSYAELNNLNAELIRGWRVLANASLNDQHYPDPSSPNLVPVAADAVRVFRGRMRSSLNRVDFVNKLATVFMPMTVQMQRLYGLTAYLPAVLPEDNGHGLPEEVALVFYKTQGAYHEAKRCVGGRAYSGLHELVFDMKTSGSEFPELFAGNVEFDKPYHLFVKSTDWQTGSVRLYVGTRRVGVTSEAFASGVGHIAEAVQQAAGMLDAVIFCLSNDWVLWWEHSLETTEREFEFNDLADQVFASPPRCLRIPPNLTQPYAGISLNASSDFVNLQFRRV